MKGFMLVLLASVGIASTASAVGGGEKRFQGSIGLIGTEIKPRFEFNIANKMGLGMEAGFSTQQDTASTDGYPAGMPEDTKTFSNREFGVIVARYTNPAVLGGFYWLGGLGYRQTDISWNRNVSGDVMTANSFRADSNGQVQHAMTAKGTAMHVRGGYRYVAESFPMTFGLYAGLRHFNSSVNDTGATDSATDPVSLSTSGDRNGIKRQLMTSLEMTLLELGVAF